MNIFVGNLPHAVNSDELRELFAGHGEVDTAKVITDKFTGNSRGFGFVEMPDATEAKTAMEALNGSDLHGRALNVNEARPQTERSGNFNRRF